MAVNLTLREIATHLEEAVKSESVAYARDMETIIDSQMKEIGVDYKEIPRSSIQEAAYSAAKDIYKITLYHPDGIDTMKVFGYFCFWVRKIKPVHGATQYGKPFRHINELLSIHMAAHLCVRFAENHPTKIPNKDVEGVKRRALNFIQDSRRVDYLVHSMRYRTFGPHHYVMILQNIIYGFEAQS
jgi:hypothetical protein